MSSLKRSFATGRGPLGSYAPGGIIELVLSGTSLFALPAES